MESNITENLFQGSYQTLIDCGVDSNNIKRYNVPGSYELIFGAKVAFKEIQMQLFAWAVLFKEKLNTLILLQMQLQLV